MVGGPATSISVWPRILWPRVFFEPLIYAEGRGWREPADPRRASAASIRGKKKEVLAADLRGRTRMAGGMNPRRASAASIRG
jgi:hypothetical protein